MKEKVYRDPVVGEVRLRKSPRARRLTLRVHPVKGILVSMPSYVRFDEGIRLVQTRREWVRSVQERQEALRKDLPGEEEIEALRSSAKAGLPPRMAALAKRYGFQYNRLTIKHNTSNWGSCSAKGNINLNLNLMRVPAPLRDYVMLHELTHLEHPDHGAAFHARLESLLADHFSRPEEAEAFRPYLPEVAASRARYPIGHVLEKALKGYLLV